jgi:hypothetical protein
VTDEERLGNHSHAELLRLAKEDTPEARLIVDRYLSAMAQDFSLEEVFAVIDTPDVFE